MFVDESAQSAVIINFLSYIKNRIQGILVDHGWCGESPLEWSVQDVNGLS